MHRSNRRVFDQLCRDLKQLCYVVCPIFDSPNDDEYEVCVGNYSVSIANAIRFIKDQGTFTADTFVALEQETQKDVEQSVPRFVLNLIDGIQQIFGERNERN